MPAVRVTLLVLALLLGAAPAAQAADVFAVGSQSRLTRVGLDGNTAVAARSPAVAHNSLQNEFLVVWVGNTTAGASNEVLGQILDGNGTPKGPVQFLSSVPDDEAAPSQPVVGYSPVDDQYVLGYIATPQVITPTPPNAPDGQRELIAQVVTATGVRSGPPTRISDTDAADADADSASDPALAYNAETDTYRFVWIASSANEDANVEVWTQGISSALVTSGGLELTVSTTPSGSVDEPVIAYLPNQNRFVIAWEAPNGTGGQAIFARVVTTGGFVLVTQLPFSNSDSLTVSASRPAIAANAGRDEVLVSFTRNDVAGEGPEVFVQLLTAAGAPTPSTADQRVSTMGPANNLAFGAHPGRNTTASLHPQLDRDLVTWAGDDDQPGLVDNEIERYGQALEGTGVEVGGDFRISATGPDGNDDVAPEITATIAVLGKRAWFNVRDADDNRPPLANNEFELYGRFVGDDGDLDGHAAPGDCDDGNPAVRPGAVDVLDNGVDEDCSGADAVSPPPVVVPAGVDGDGDGFFAGQDCNDANGAIRPGAVEVRGNGVDENCDKVVEPFPTLTSGVVHNWSFKRASPTFTLKVLQVTQQFPKGWKAEIRCSGKKCPFKAKALKAAKVKRNASNVIGSLKGKQRRFRAGQTVEVWISAPGFNTKVARIPLKQGKQPVIQALCVVPGQSKPQRSCT